MKEVGAHRTDKIVVSVSLPILTADSTKYYGVFNVPFDCKLVSIWLAFQDVPASALGTVLFNIYNRDQSGGPATDALLETADLNLEGETDLTPTELILTSTAADLILAKSDFIHAKVVSNNGDMTAGEGGCITLVLEPSVQET